MLSLSTYIAKASIYIQPFVVLIYTFLSITALYSLKSNALTDLASSGKIRNYLQTSTTSNNDDCQQVSHPIIRKVYYICNKIDEYKCFFLNHDLFLVNKSLYSHFYTVGLVSYSILFFCLSLLYGNHETIHKHIIIYKIFVAYNYFQVFDRHLKIATLMLHFHLFRRCLECRYVHVWKIHKSNSRNLSKKTENTQAKMHVAGYVLGILHYVILPLVFLPDLSFRGEEDVLTGKENTVTECEKNNHSNKVPKVLMTACAVMLYLICQIEQYRHHVILANLRTKNNKYSDPDSSSKKERENKQEQVRKMEPPSSNQQGEYFIPHGRLFEYVSCPHYFIEILIYLSFAIILSLNSSQSYKNSGNCETMKNENSYTLEQCIDHNYLWSRNKYLQYKHWSLLFWVVTNLMVSAVHNDHWYKKTFGNQYPIRRKRLIPFIW